MVVTILEMTALVVCGYLLGNVFGAKILCKITGDDLSKKGSGNYGTMNTLRSIGAFQGLAVLLFDALKGSLIAFLGYLICGQLGLYIGGLAVIIGHIFPVFYHFKGGKGFATFIGVVCVANWIVGVPLFVLLVIMICITKQGAICDLSYALIMAIVNTIMSGSHNAFVYILLWGITALVFWAHRTNIVRIVQHKENKTELASQIKKAFTHKHKDKTNNDTNTTEPTANASESVESKVNEAVAQTEPDKVEQNEESKNIVDNGDK